MSDQMKAIEQVIRQANVRHGVITSNIANVDTPNYKVRDVSFAPILDNEMRLATTDPKHLPSAEGSAAGVITVDSANPWADKNNVEMDVEVAKMTENAMRYQAGVTLLEKKITMFKSALRTTG
jgi:flagellar basal-body rod protein FlgB